MDNQSSQSVPQSSITQPQPLSPTPRKSVKWRLFVSLLVLILIAAVCAVYVWQHNKNTKLDTQVSSLQSRSATQEKKISALGKQLAESSKATQSKSTAAGPFDQTAAITKAVKAYKDNASNAAQLNVTINGVTASGNAAYGSASVSGRDGGGVWLAINTDGNWSVVSQGAAGFCKDQMQQYNLPVVWAEDPIC